MKKSADTFPNGARHALLDLHRSLLDAQRIRYERDHGRIETSGEFLGLVLEHPSFEWLRELSALIAQLDEWLEGGEAARPAEFEEILASLRSMIQAGGANTRFNKPYWELVEEVPAVLVEHVKVWRLLGPQKSDGESARPAVT
jgi:hypothetical protein